MRFWAELLGVTTPVCSLAFRGSFYLLDNHLASTYYMPGTEMGTVFLGT